MSEINRQKIKETMILMIQTKEGLGTDNIPNVDPLEKKLELEGQIGAKLRDELLKEIKAATTPKKPAAKKKTAKATTPKKPSPGKKAAIKEEPLKEDKSSSSAGPKKTSILTIRDGYTVRIHFEDGKQVRVEKIKKVG